jgi:cytochrome c biogenesis protein CcmG, thiol:disulfide interchange protein DsbE
VNPRSRTPLIIAVVIVIVALAGLVAALATRGGGDDDDSDATTTSITYGKVTVTGTALPEGQGPQDPAIGSRVPSITGTDYTGNPVTVAPGKDGPLMIVVMAHWCPHCNNEVPKLIDWKKSGQVPDGLRVVGISTAATDGAPHFPPGEWLDQLGWDWPVIADDQQQTAAAAVGTPAYPFLVFVDAKGDVIARVSGELAIEDVQHFADAAAATAP